MSATAYYVEPDRGRTQDEPRSWALFCAPGDDGYPSRHVGSFGSFEAAERQARTLQYIVREYDAATARECEAVACRIGPYGKAVGA